MPQIFVDVDRVQAQSLGVPIGNVFSTLQSYTGSTYVNQFNLFNQSYQTYVQADSPFRLQPEDIATAAHPQQRRPDGAAGGAGRHPLHRSAATISRYNLYPTVGSTAAPRPASAPARRCR